MFEIIDHISTNWIYIDHLSIFNWLFYSFLSIGLSFLSISVTNKKSIIAINIMLIFGIIFSYWYLGKFTTLLFQVFISIILISVWWNRFKDSVFLIYPIMGVLFTTLFGIILSSSGKQIWHLFIGPSGTISTLAFYSVLNRSRKKINHF